MDSNAASVQTISANPNPLTAQPKKTQAIMISIAINKKTTSKNSKK